MHQAPPHGALEFKPQQDRPSDSGRHPLAGLHRLDPVGDVDLVHDDDGPLAMHDPHLLHGNLAAHDNAFAHDDLAMDDHNPASAIDGLDPLDRD